MSDITAEDFLKLGGDPKTGKNALDLLSMFKELNTVLGEVRKTIKFLDDTGLKTVVVRAAGKKYGVDVDKPLLSDNAIIPKSDLHKLTFNQLNNLPETGLAEFLKGMQEGPKENNP